MLSEEKQTGSDSSAEASVDDCGLALSSATYANHRTDHHEISINPRTKFNTLAQEKHVAMPLTYVHP